MLAEKKARNKITIVEKLPIMNLDVVKMIILKENETIIRTNFKKIKEVEIMIITTIVATILVEIMLVMTKEGEMTTVIQMI